MKKINWLLFFVFFATIINAQTAQDYINSCVKEEQNKGASNIIVSAMLCSACRGKSIQEGFIFIKDSTGIFKVRYLKYLIFPASVKILKDDVFIDEDVKSVFDMEELFHDSIFYEIPRLERIITEENIDGNISYSEITLHGKIKFFAVFNKFSYVSTYISYFYSTGSFEKTYHYWLLNSSINNYINEYLRPKLLKKRKSSN